MFNMKKIMASAALSLVLVSGFGGAKVQAAATVTRIYGADRIETADQLAKNQFPSAQNVVLVNGYGYADAVSATPLAKQLGAPILLTAGGDQLESQVMDTIKQLGAKNVYIIGGTGVVSDSIETSFKDGGYTVQRVSSTTDTTRMGTNAEVAKLVLQKSGTGTAMLVNGKDGYADALSVAAIAAQKGYPVLFASSSEVSPVVKDVITSKNLSIMAVGGDAVLPNNVVSSVGGSKITGNTATRYATNLAVLDYFNNHGGLAFSTVYVAAGGNNATQFADALVASAAAAKAGAPLVLSSSNVDTYAQSARNYILTMNDNPQIIMIGGTGSLSSAVEDLLKNDDPFQVIGIE